MRVADIRRLLPAVMQRAATEGTPLEALLATMEAIHAPIEGAFSRFPFALDPRTAPAEFLPFISEWVDVRDLASMETRTDARVSRGREPDSENARLRALAMAAAELAKWRGTRRGLLRLLELATGVTGFEIVEGRASDGTPRPFSIDVIVPADAAAALPLVTRILTKEKPAYATCSIRIAEPAETARGAAGATT
jgi:phage tail-like protein